MSILSTLYSRKVGFFYLSFLLFFFAGWYYSAMKPAVDCIQQEDYHLFYGNVSRAAIPGIFGNTDIPFLDKTIFQLNYDTDVDFILYAPRDMVEEMGDWYSFAAINAAEVPLEVTAIRVSEKKFVVISMATSEGELVPQDVLAYIVDKANVAVNVCLGLVIGGVVFLILGIITKRRKKLPPKKSPKKPVKDYSSMENYGYVHGAMPGIRYPRDFHPTLIDTEKKPE